MLINKTLCLHKIFNKSVSPQKWPHPLREQQKMVFVLTFQSFFLSSVSLQSSLPSCPQVPVLKIEALISNSILLSLQQIIPTLQMIPNLQNQQQWDSMKSRPTLPHQMTFLKKQLQRKPSNYLPTTNNKDKNSITDSFKYLISVPIKSDISNSTASLHNPKVKSVFCMEEIKTERKENKAEGQRLNKKNAEGQADYYKYWKKKASQYQSENFDLHKANSSLQSQNQILKFKIEKLQKKIEGFNSTQQSKKDKAQENTDRLQNIFRIKIEQLIRKISEKEILIQKLSQKISELSNEVSENSRMQSVIDNMQQRFSEIKSSCGSVNDSTSNFGYDQSEPQPKSKNLKKKYSDFLDPQQNGGALKKSMNHTSSYFSIERKQWD